MCFTFEGTAVADGESSHGNRAAQAGDEAGQRGHACAAAGHEAATGHDQPAAGGVAGASPRLPRRVREDHQETA